VWRSFLGRERGRSGNAYFTLISASVHSWRVHGPKLMSAVITASPRPFCGGATEKVAAPAGRARLSFYGFRR
jgi:hypothetical protein